MLDGSYHKYDYRFKIIIFLFLFVLITSLQPYTTYILLLFVISLYVLLPIRKYWDSIAFFLFLFSFIYSSCVYINGYNVGLVNILLYLFSPVAFYILGRYLVSSVNKDERSIMKIILLIILFYSLPVYMIVFKNIIDTGEFVNVYRVLTEDETQQRAATLYGLQVSAGFGLLGLIFYFKRIPLVYKFISIFIFVSSLIVVIHLVNRTGLYVIILVFFALLLYSIKKRKPHIVICALIALLFMYVFPNDFFIDAQILEAYDKRNIEGFDVKNVGGRLDLWEFALNNILKEPFGWSGRYAHNLWLDIARVSGIFAFITFLFATIDYFSKAVKIINKDDTVVIILLIGLNVAFLASSFVEPVIEGCFSYFCLFLLLWGVTKEMVKKIY